MCNHMRTLVIRRIDADASETAEVLGFLALIALMGAVDAAMASDAGTCLQRAGDSTTGAPISSSLDASMSAYDIRVAAARAGRCNYVTGVGTAVTTSNRKHARRSKCI
jgi:hypothetical protein